jgi:hypothetical protein
MCRLKRPVVLLPRNLHLVFVRRPLLLSNWQLMKVRVEILCRLTLRLGVWPNALRRPALRLEMLLEMRLDLCVELRLEMGLEMGLAGPRDPETLGSHVRDATHDQEAGRGTEHRQHGTPMRRHSGEFG